MKEKRKSSGLIFSSSMWLDQRVTSFDGDVFKWGSNCSITAPLRIKYSLFWADLWRWHLLFFPNTHRSVCAPQITEFWFLTSRARRWFRSCSRCICSSPALEGRSRWRRTSTRTADPGWHAWTAAGCSPVGGRWQRSAQRREQPRTRGPRSLRRAAEQLSAPPLWRPPPGPPLTGRSYVPQEAERFKQTH